MNFGSRFLYDVFFNFWVSVIFAYFTGMAVNFALSRKYVFQNYAGASIHKTFIKFSIVALFGLAVTACVSIFAVEFLFVHTELDEELSKALAHTLGIGAAFFASFFGHKFITFNRTGIASLIKGKLK